MKALEVNNLKKTYKNGVVALKGIDLTSRKAISSPCWAPTAPASRR